MANAVIGVRFREASKIYHFAPTEAPVHVGEHVVVRTARGEEIARVVFTPDSEAGPPPSDVKPILRLATREDQDRANVCRDQADAILRRMRAIVSELELPMYVAACQLPLQGREGTAFFEADIHVDFRPVLEVIETEFDVRLHLMQIGPRDRAKLVDGYDLCGLRLCCAAWMPQFPQVGIRMAKEQDLSVNPDKISGVCGRLLCCLTFEFDTYREMRGAMPKVGKQVSTPVGQGKVVAVHVLKQTFTVALMDTGQRVEVPVAEMGTAVRLEAAPNQALIEAAAETGVAAQGEAGVVEAGAAETEPAEPGGAKRRRRRRRKPGGPGPPAEAGTEPSAETGAAAPVDGTPPPSTDAGRQEPGGAAGETAARPTRRRRRRRGPGPGVAAEGGPTAT